MSKVIGNDTDVKVAKEKVEDMITDKLEKIETELMESCNEMVKKWLKSKFNRLRDQYKDNMYSNNENTSNIIKNMMNG